MKSDISIMRGHSKSSIAKSPFMILFFFQNHRNNATIMNADTALTTTWVGGSVTPLTGLNSGKPNSVPRFLVLTHRPGFSMYEVDPETFEYAKPFLL